MNYTSSNIQVLDLSKDGLSLFGLGKKLDSLFESKLKDLDVSTLSGELAYYQIASRGESAIYKLLSKEFVVRNINAVQNIYIGLENNKAIHAIFIDCENDSDLNTVKEKLITILGNYTALTSSGYKGIDSSTGFLWYKPQSLITLEAQRGRLQLRFEVCKETN